MKVKKLIITIREAIAVHISNEYLRDLLYGLLSYEMMYYVFFGLFTAIIDYAVYVSLYHVGLNAMSSNVFSWICAVIFSFTTNRLWVFKMGFDDKKELFRSFRHFVYARLTTLIMTEVLLFIAQITSLNTYYTKMFAMILTVIINYLLSKLFIFNKNYKK